MYTELHSGPKRGVSVYSYSGEDGWSIDHLIFKVQVSDFDVDETVLPDAG